MIRKYLCENIVRLLEAYIELTECNFVFIWSSDPVLLQHIFCLTESDSFLRQVETWHNCVVKSGNFTKIVSQKSGDAPYCQPEPGAGKWWYFFFKCPLAMYILCPMFNLFLIKYKGVFHERKFVFTLFQVFYNLLLQCKGCSSQWKAHLQNRHQQWKEHNVCIIYAKTLHRFFQISLCPLTPHIWLWTSSLLLFSQ